MSKEIYVINTEELEKLIFPKIYELKHKNNDINFNIDLEKIYNNIVNNG